MAIYTSSYTGAQIDASVAKNISGYTYSDIGYAATPVSVASGTNTLSLDGTTPLYIVTLGDNINTILLSTLPAVGHSCHVIFTASTAKTVTIAHVSTGTTRYICPEGASPDPIDVPAGGYVEVDFLRGADTEENNDTVYWIFVRGI